MLNSADRRPERIDLPLRRIRATVPAHSNPLGPVAFLGQFDSLIERVSLNTRDVA